MLSPQYQKLVPRTQSEVTVKQYLKSLIDYHLYTLYGSQESWERHCCSSSSLLETTVVQMTIVQMTIVQMTIVQMTVVQMTVVQMTIVQMTVSPDDNSPDHMGAEVQNSFKEVPRGDQYSKLTVSREASGIREICVSKSDMSGFLRKCHFLSPGGPQKKLGDIISCKIKK